MNTTMRLQRGKVAFLLILSCVAIFSWTRCKTGANSQTEGASLSKEEVALQVEKLREQLSKIDDSDFLSQMKLIRQMAELQIQIAADKQEATQVFSDYKTHFFVLLDQLCMKEEEFLSQYAEYAYQEGADASQSKKEIQQKEELFASAGLKVQSLGEGEYTLQPKDDFFDIFLDKVEPSYREFYQLEQLTETSRVLQDAALLIPLPELGDLLVRFEKYAKEYHLGVYLENFSEAYQLYQMVYLLGIDNTPHTDHSGKLLPEVRQEFERFMNTYPESYTSILIPQVLSLWEAGDAQMHQKLLQRQKELDTPLVQGYPDVD